MNIRTALFEQWRNVLTGQPDNEENEFRDILRAVQQVDSTCGIYAAGALAGLVAAEIAEYHEYMKRLQGRIFAYYGIRKFRRRVQIELNPHLGFEA